MKLHEINLSTGIDRRAGASKSAAYSLNNARLVSVDVHALQEGVAHADINGLKPFWEVGSELLTNCNATVGDGIRAGDWHNTSFYGVGCGCNGDTSCGTAQVLPSDYDGTNPLPGTARITNAVQVSIANSQKGSNPVIDLGVAPGKAASYLFIPFNERDEAGTWFYRYFINSGTVFQSPYYEITASVEAHRMEVYRTPDFDPADGSVHDVDSSCTLRQYYFVRDMSLSVCRETVPGAAITDPAIFFTATAVNDSDATPPGSQSPVEYIDLYFDIDQYALPAGFFAPAVVEVAAQMALAVQLTTGSQWNVLEAGWVNVGAGSAFGIPNINQLYRVRIDLGGVGPLVYSTEVAAILVQAQFNFIPAFAAGAIGVVTSRSWIFKDDVAIRYEANDNTDSTSVADSLNLVNTAGALLSQSRNVHTTDPITGALRGFCAGAMHNDAGTMLYGNVTWATREPALTYVNFTVGGGEDILVVYEYQRNGKPVYGPETLLGDKAGGTGGVDRLTVDLAGGEVAVLIFVKNLGGQYLLHERVAITGTYYIGSCGGCLTWNGTDFNIADATAETWTADYLPDQVACVAEPNKIFLSTSQRPLEITFNQGAVNANETVRHIGPARLSEAESLASYSFYIATDATIHVASQANDAISLRQVTSELGVSLGGDGQALWVSTHTGAVFQGTDDHLWYIVGRETLSLDDHIRGTDVVSDLYTTIHDIAYHVDNREIYLATDTGIWVYDLGNSNIGNRRGIIAHYDVSAALGGAATRVYYRKSLRAIVASVAVTGATTAARTLSETGALLPDVSMTTQYLFDDIIMEQFDKIVPDFDAMPSSRTIGDSANGWDYGTLTLSVRPTFETTTPAGVVVNPTFVGVTGQTILQVEPGSPKYPMIQGRGQRIQLGEFESFRSLGVVVVGAPVD